MLVARTHRQQTGDMSLPIVGIGLSERLQNYQASSDSVIVFETFFLYFSATLNLMLAIDLYI